MQLAIVLGRKARLAVVLRGALRKTLRRQPSGTSNQVRLLRFKVERCRIEDRGIGKVRHSGMLAVSAGDVVWQKLRPGTAGSSSALLQRRRRRRSQRIDARPWIGRRQLK